MRCPECSGPISLGQKDYECQRCAGRYAFRSGVLDLRSRTAQTAEDVTIHRDHRSWVRWAQSDARADPSRSLDEIASAARTACKLLLSLPPNATVLEIGCGSGRLLSGLAPVASRAFGIDVDPFLLGLARCRLSAVAERRAFTLVLVRSVRDLPFSDDFFDCVVLSPRVATTGDGELKVAMAAEPTLGRLSEIARVLKPGGQLFLTGSNRFGFDKFSRPRMRPRSRPTFAGHSWFGYRRLLKNAGFDRQDFVEMVGGDTRLHRIRSLEPGADRWVSEAPPTLKSKIKRHRLFVPCFGISATTTSPTRPNLLAELLDTVAAGIDGGEGSQPPRVEHFRVSRKDKAILTLRQGRRRWMLRLPLSSAAEVSDGRNAHMLRVARRNSTLGAIVPEPVAHGEHRGLSWYVESHLTGIPLARALRDAGPESFFDHALDLLGKLNAGGGTPLTMDETRFDRTVTTRLSKLELLVDDSVVLGRLRAYFHRALGGSKLAFGTVHGDFSVNNILLDRQNRVTGLIDWEDADDDGVVLVDGINFVESWRRATTGETVGEVIPELARSRFRSKHEEEFLLALYDIGGTDPALHAPLVYFKWLRHMSYLQRFWLQYDSAAIRRFVDPVVRAILEQDEL